MAHSPPFTAPTFNEHLLGAGALLQPDLHKHTPGGGAGTHPAGNARQPQAPPTPPAQPRPTLLVEISAVAEAGGVTSAIDLVVPVADKLLPRTAVALGDGGVVELLWRDALQWLGIAWGHSSGRGGRAAGRPRPLPPAPTTRGRD